MSEYTGPDRRKKPTPFLSRYSFSGGRRMSGGERGVSFSDRYHFLTWVVLSLFLVLNVLDAHFTLIYLQRGGEEANPIVALLLNQGISFFIVFKSLGVALGALIFCVLADFRNAKIGVILALSFYQLLLFYHIALYLNLLGSVSA